MTDHQPPFDHPGRSEDVHAWDSPYLLEVLAKWQPRLGLEDWDIRIRWARTYDLGANVTGDVIMEFQKRMAVIRVGLASDWDPGIPWKYDAEYVVVHELCHLHINRIVKDGPSEGEVGPDAEYAIHALARALIAADRGASSWR